MFPDPLAKKYCPELTGICSCPVSCPLPHDPAAKGQFLRAKQWDGAEAGRRFRARPPPAPRLDILCWLRGQRLLCLERGRYRNRLAPSSKWPWGPAFAQREPAEPGTWLFLESDQVPSTQLSFPPVGLLTVPQCLCSGPCQFFAGEFSCSLGQHEVPLSVTCHLSGPAWPCK